MSFRSSGAVFRFILLNDTELDHSNDADDCDQD